MLDNKMDIIGNILGNSKDKIAVKVMQAHNKKWVWLEGRIINKTSKGYKVSVFKESGREILLPNIILKSRIRKYTNERRLK